MSPRRTMSTALRVLQQLHHDRRTIALILFVPSILIVILRYVFDGADVLFDQTAPLMLGIFPFTVMFVVTSITTLRERTNGTLERLMTMPMGKLDFILGYALAFSLLVLLQAGLASLVAIGWLGVSVEAGAAALVAVALTSALVGISFGLFVSAFANSEFQVVQFMPALVFPQLLMCGLFVARDQMHEVLQWLANLMPLTYVIEAMQAVTGQSGWSDDLMRNLLILLGYAVAALVLAALTLRRRH